MRSISRLRRGAPVAAGMLVALIGLSFAGTGLAQEATSRSTYPAPPPLLAAFDVQAATVQHLDVERAANGDVAVPVELGGQLRHLALQPHEIRAPGFQLLVRDDQGLHAVARPANVTYRGTVLEVSGSWVAATVEGDGIKAVVHLPGGDEWALQPVSQASRQAGPALHIVYRTADNTNLPWTCGVQGQLAGPVPPAPGLDLSYICEIACEADFQYYQLNGSNVTATQNDVTGIINATSAIWLADVQVSFTITTIIVNTSSASNPYTSSNAGTLLGQFQSHWNNNHQGIVRDVAHLFTGRNMGQVSGGAIGIAFLGTACGLGSAYGVSQSRWTSNYPRRVCVTAHEIGHNFGAQHCDAVPPCYIMCSGVGGCQNVQTTFSQNERNQIIGFANGLGCLDLVPNTPSITNVVPAQVSTFQPGIVTLTGTGFVGTTQLQIGPATLTSGFTVQSDSSLQFNPPVGLPLGPAAIQTTNSAGTSNAQNITILQADPCAMLVPTAVLGGNNLTWTFAGGPNNGWFVVISILNSTTPFQGWPVVDNPLVLAFGGLDPQNGMGTYAVPIPPMTFSGITIYSQVIEFLPAAAFTVDSTSAVRPTLIVL
jgi:hypothetical protein